MNSGSIPFTPGARVVAYLRDSGGDEQDLSVDQQAAYISTWCSEHALVLGAVYTDRAMPGSSTVGRVQFHEMVQMFRSPGCTAAGLIVWKYSRFARDIDDASFYKADLRRRGYVIHSIQDNIPEGLDGRFFEAAIDWMNARFLEDLSTDVRRGLHYNLTQYGAIPGTPPRGFRREPVDVGRRRDGKAHIIHRWVPDPVTWPRVKRAWQMRAVGATYAEIEAECHLYRQRSDYSTMFRNRIYLGELRFGDTLIKNYVEPMVDEITWARVQAMTKTIKRLQTTRPQRHPRRASSDFLLSGLVTCARCGSLLNGNTLRTGGGKYVNHYYTCSLKRRDRSRCDASDIPQAFLEELILSELTDHVLQIDRLAHIQTLARGSESDRLKSLRDERAGHQHALAATRQRIAKLVDTIADSGHSPAILQRLSDLEHEERDLVARVDEVDEAIQNVGYNLSQTQLAAVANQIIAALRSPHLSERRTALRALVSSIVVERTEENKIAGEIRFYVPSGDFMATGQCPQGVFTHSHKFSAVFRPHDRSA